MPIHADPFVCTYWPAYLRRAKIGLNRCSIQRATRTTVKLLSPDKRTEASVVIAHRKHLGRAAKDGGEDVKIRSGE